MKSSELCRMVGCIIDLLAIVKAQLDSREDAYDLVKSASTDLCKLHDWILLTSWEA